jgi:hypothetical protein
MPQPEAPRLPLEKARECEGGSRTAWCATYWRGGSAQPGGGGRGSQRSLPSCLKCTKMMSNGWFSAFIYLKIATNYVIYFKVLNKIYSRDVFLRNNHFVATVLYKKKMGRFAPRCA